MKKLTVIIAAVAATALNFSAFAGPIPQFTGSIGFSGTYTANGTGTGDLGVIHSTTSGANSTITSITGVPTDVTSASGTVNNTTSGDFLNITPTIVGSAVNFIIPISLQLNNNTTEFFYINTPDPTVGSKLEFFSTSLISSSYDGGAVFVGATLPTSSLNVFKASPSWSLTGTGYFEEVNAANQVIAGGPDDSGTWQINLGATRTSFEFGGTGGVTAPLVPDGGTTIALLGGAMIGLQAFRRKQSR